ncbi:MAG TPA: rhodanese-like domain-containing protein [Gammaproteobacteria bacterium]|jgi:phage shock protein E|nr:rhodanese-like domain-containing protein [Gammaproteobacteria bacterium]HIK72373.1 rhodanese-like domain-containing protein [Gammaproteobacteria bacterium]
MKKVISITLILLSLSLFSEELIVDVRTLAEWNQGHLASAKRIEWQEISKKIQSLNLDMDNEIILYCRSGIRAGKAKIILNDLGYINVTNAGSLLEAKNLVGDEIEK